MSRPGRSLVGMGLLALTAGGPPVRADDPFVVAARDRQERYAVVRLRVHLEHFIAKGASSDALKAMAGSQQRVIPVEDTTYRSDNVLVFHGSSARLEDNHPRLNATVGEMVVHPAIHVTDGRSAKSLQPSVPGLPYVDHGLIKRGAELPELKAAWWLPVGLHYRGLSPAMTVPVIVSSVPSGGRTSIDGIDCAEYKYTLTPTSQKVILVDEKAGYVVRRVRHLTDNRVDRQHTIRYSADGEPRPIGWVWTLFGQHGRATETVTATVTGEHDERPVTAGDFQLPFPAGYTVSDARDGKAYRAQADGTMTQLDLRTGQPAGPVVDQPTTGWLRRNRPFLVASVLLAGLTAVAVRRPHR